MIMKLLHWDLMIEVGEITGNQYIFDYIQKLLWFM